MIGGSIPPRSVLLSPGKFFLPKNDPENTSTKRPKSCKITQELHSFATCGHPSKVVWGQGSLAKVAEDLFQRTIFVGEARTPKGKEMALPVLA